MGNQDIVYQDIVMNEKHFVDLRDPVNVQDAATKNYVNTALTYVNSQDFATKNYVDTDLSSVNANPLKKCHVGYIPNLERDVSETEFVVSASSITAEGYRPYGAFNTLNNA